MNDALNQKFKKKAPRSDEVVMAADDTEYSWAIPAGTSEFTLLMKDTATGLLTNAWRFSGETGEVATAPGGTSIAAGASVVYDAGLYTGAVYFAHTAGASQTMRVEYTR